MAELLKMIEESKLDRRRFVQIAAATGVVATLGLTGCENKVEETTSTSPTVETLSGGQWRPIACQFDCGVRCINMAYFVDGIPLRQKTDDRHPDSADYPQQRGCIKGRSNRQLIMGADRLKYPMKRKNWEPGGSGGDVTLRGRDEWERLSWDEALNLIASEFKRIKDTYGNAAFLSPGLGSNMAEGGNYSGILLAAYGGCVTVWGQQSKGGLPLVTNTISQGYLKGGGDRIAMRKGKLIVLWGFNSCWSIGGTHTKAMRDAKDAGAKIILVDPWYNPTAQGIADEWIPCRPGTDAAFLCAIAYHMIENNLQDQEYLDKYCLGFDADHMPPGEEGQENFKDYILGAYDGIPKTAEWASEICGVAPATIRDLAEQMATAKPMSLRGVSAPFRTDSGQQTAQIFYTVGWMTGNPGTPGGDLSAGHGFEAVDNGYGLVGLGDAGIFERPTNPVCSQPRGGGQLEKGTFDPGQYYGVAYAEMWEAVLTGKHHHFLDGVVDCNFKAIFKTEKCAPFNQIINLKRGVEALRTPGKIEFVVSVDFFLTTDCLFSDIVLPGTTRWENEGGYCEAMNREAVSITPKVIEPMFEAQPDWWIDKELAIRLGIDESVVCPPNPQANFPMRVANAFVIDKDGNEGPLATITAEDIAEMGLTCEPQEGVMPIKEIYAQGGYQVERFDGDTYGFTPLADYIADPVANAVPTATGKLEIFSRTLAQRAANYATTPLAPIGKYRPCREGYEASFTDWENKVRGEYTFQLITLHQHKQAHSMGFNCKSLSELFSNAAIINDRDAAALGLKTNDTALITSMHGGQSLRRVQATARLMPGVILMGEGAWLTLDEATGIDTAGSVNYITGGILTGEGQSPYNSVLLKVEKYTGTPLEPDYMVPQRIINL